MDPVTRDEIIAGLVERGTRRDIASQYADVYTTYREATTHIGQHGSVVAHPRTGVPLENPFLKVRAEALKQLQAMRQIDASWLW